MILSQDFIRRPGKAEAQSGFVAATFSINLRLFHMKSGPTAAKNKNANNHVLKTSSLIL